MRLISVNSLVLIKSRHRAETEPIECVEKVEAVEEKPHSM